MPGPYGSVANPVQLDPFRRIVEVHWNSVKYLQINVRLARSLAGAGGNVCGGGSPVPVDDYVRIYTSEFQFRNWMSNVGFPADDYSGAMIYANHEWVSPGETITVTGMPDLKKLATEFGGDGHFGFGYMEIANGNTRIVNPTDPYAIWSIPAGSDAEIPAPDGGAFKLGLPTIDIMGRSIGGLACYDWGGGLGYIESGLAAPYAAVSSWNPYASATATYRGKTFAPVACRLSGPGEIKGDATGENPATSIVSILFQKVTTP